jgi:hypothetical protein
MTNCSRNIGPEKDRASSTTLPSTALPTRLVTRLRLVADTVSIALHPCLSCRTRWYSATAGRPEASHSQDKLDLERAPVLATGSIGLTQNRPPQAHNSMLAKLKRETVYEGSDIGNNGSVPGRLVPSSVANNPQLQSASLPTRPCTITCPKCARPKSELLVTRLQSQMYLV